MGHVFGYGSLVNARSHDLGPVEAARLVGWRRTWFQAEGRQTAFLAVRPAGPDDTVEGAVAAVPDADWPALDIREASYTRVGATVQCRDGARDVKLYRLPDPLPAPPEAPLPILLSYLGVVVAGLLEVWGPNAVERFVAETDGWDAPIRDDRLNPVYPRSHAATKAATELIDRHLTLDFLARLRNAGGGAIVGT